MLGFFRDNESSSAIVLQISLGNIKPCGNENRTSKCFCVHFFSFLLMFALARNLSLLTREYIYGNAQERVINSELPLFLH